MITHKEYYSLEEVTNRFNVSLADIEYFAQQGELEISVRFAEVIIDNHKIKRLSHQNNNSLIIRRNKVLITKPKALMRADACALFRRKKAVIPAFRNYEELKVLSFIEGSNILVKYDDMIITQAELSRFSIGSKFFIEDFDGKFKHKNNYQKVICNGVEFSFGEIQAQIIRQLYYASKTNEPWVNGKMLMLQAGSNANRIGGLFQRNPNWREIICSDGKGNYSLNIKSTK